MHSAMPGDTRFRPGVSARNIWNEVNAGDPDVGVAIYTEKLHLIVG